MPYSIYTLQDQGLCGIKFSGQIATDDLTDAAEELIAYADLSKIGVIFDLTQVRRLPPNFTNYAFSDEDFICFIRHPNVIAVAFIRPDVITMMNLSVIMAEKPYGVFEDREQAQHFLRKQMAYPPVR